MIAFDVVSLRQERNVHSCACFGVSFVGFKHRAPNGALRVRGAMMLLSGSAALNRHAHRLDRQGGRVLLP